MKKLLPILTLASLLPAQAQTAYTAPSGYVKLTADGATTASGSKLTVISVTLLNEVEFSGTIAIGSFTPAGATPPQVPESQTITSTGANWATDSWAGTHLAYLTDGTGAEQAFLIISNTADTLVVQTSFDLKTDLNDSPSVEELRFPANSTLKIRKAHTISSLFGDDVGETGNFDANDRIYLWTGSTWNNYSQFDTDAANPGGGIWINNTESRNGNDDIVFPDEGIFIQNQGTADVGLTVFGDVPTQPQATSIPGSSLSFISTSFPVNAGVLQNTLGNINFENLPSWDDNDRLYIWDGSRWLNFSYFSASSVWVNNTEGAAANDYVVPANAAIFVQKSSSGNAASSRLIQSVPFTTN